MGYDLTDFVGPISGFHNTLRYDYGPKTKLGGLGSKYLRESRGSALDSSIWLDTELDLLHTSFQCASYDTFKTNYYNGF